MDKSTNMFRGIITPILTPFYNDEVQSINYEATKEMIEHLISMGVNGIFPLGSNGEFFVLSHDEKVEFVSEVVKIVSGRVPVFAGSGCCSTKETVELSRKFEEIGVDALSILPPYFVSPNNDELYSHYKTVAESVSIPIVLYNIPRLTGTNLDPVLVERLVEINNIKAIKDSSRNISNLKAYIEIANENSVDVLVGSDSLIYEGYKLGASGAIAGLSNVVTKEIVSLFRALEAKEDTKAKELQDNLEVLRKVNAMGTMPSILKRAQELAGIAKCGPSRYPTSKPSRDVDDEILSMLRHYGLVD